MEAQVGSLVEIAGCVCKEQVSKSLKRKKIEVVVVEQARRIVKRVEPVVREQKRVQVGKKKESNVKAAAVQDESTAKTNEKVQGEAPWLKVVGKKAAKSAVREVNREVKRALAGPKPITPVSVIYMRFFLRNVGLA